MGCGTSKFDNAEVVRCKNRKLLIQQAVSSRHAFAAAHAAYVQALRNVAAAFRGFAETHEFETPTQEPVELKPPPPPMLYSTSPSLASPRGENIMRAMSLPVFTLQKQPSSPPKINKKTYITNSHKDATDEENGTLFKKMQRSPSPPLSSSPLPSSSAPPPAQANSTFDFFNVFPLDSTMNVQEPRKMQQVLETVGEQQESGYGREAESDDSESGESDEHDHKQQVPEQLRENQLSPEALEQAMNKPEKTSMPEESLPKDIASMSNPNWPMIRHSPNVIKDLADVLREVDECFLAAYRTGKDVSVMLEARKTHYHSNFVDNKGYFDHSRKVLNAISWGYYDESNKVPLASQEDRRDIEEHHIQESHATILDKLLAWEKKLYDEVKGAQFIEVEYDRKHTALQHQENKVDEPEGLEKLRAVVKALHTRITVAVEAINTASSAINRLRDEELYPQLQELVSGLRQMWEKMYSCHQQQDSVVKQLNRLDNLKSTGKTTSLQMLATKELESTLYAWHSTLSESIASQKSFVHDLNKWIDLSVIPLDILSNYGSHSPFKRNPPISVLCQEWEKALETLRVEVAVENIKQLAQTVTEMVEEHAQEKTYQKRAETLSKELRKREDALRNYERRFAGRFAMLDEKPEGGAIERDPLREKKVPIENIRARLDEENKLIADSLKKSRDMITTQFTRHLKATFQPVATFASLCSVAYQGLTKEENMGTYTRLAQI